MKKLFVLLVLFAFLSVTLYGASLNDLSPELLRKYNNESLNITTATSTKMTGGSYYWGKGISTTSLSGESSVKWDSFMGNNPISKVDFYNIAGYPDDANSYKEMLERNKKMGTAYWSILGVGTVVSTIGLIMMYSNFDNDTNFATGTITAYSGIGIMLLALPFYYLKDDGSSFSVTFALRIADDYNAQLLEKLAKSK
jgi:hypothetical protein